jgi:hypothetical protein
VFRFSGLEIRFFAVKHGLSFNLGLLHPVAPVFNENHKSIPFVRNLSRLYCTQYNITLHVSAIRPSSGVLYIQKC